MDDLPPVVPFPEKQRNRRWWVLKVRIHGHNSLAARNGKSCKKAVLMSEIPGEAHAFNPRVLVVERGDLIPGVLLRTSVVHQDEFPRYAEGCEGLHQALVQFLKVVLL